MTYEYVFVDGVTGDEEILLMRRLAKEIDTSGVRFAINGVKDMHRDHVHVQASHIFSESSSFITITLIYADKSQRSVGCTKDGVFNDDDVLRFSRDVIALMKN